MTVLAAWLQTKKKKMIYLVWWMNCTLREMKQPAGKNIYIQKSVQQRVLRHLLHHTRWHEWLRRFIGFHLAKVYTENTIHLSWKPRSIEFTSKTLGLIDAQLQLDNWRLAYTTLDFWKQVTFNFCFVKKKNIEIVKPSQIPLLCVFFCMSFYKCAFSFY